LILLVNWWVFFLWRDFTAWSFEVFLLLIFWGVTLYMLAVVLYPPDIRGDESYVELLERNRRWLFGVFILFLLLDLAQTAARGALLRPPIYVPFILHYVALSGVGIAVRDRRYQTFYAWYTLVSVLTWSLVVRRLLGT
jgi:hypothetical protein